MCGVGGYIKIGSQDFFSDEKILQKMHEIIAHRGPNAHKIWIDNKREVALVHRRLSIVDLTDAGTQPMFDKDYTVTICFNGEVYNYKQLRKELEFLGHNFFSQSDTEVFLYAFKQWGIACLDRLEGMFAGVLGDLKKNEWYIFRDRMGIKPFYFSFEGGYLSFASEIKALTVLPWINKELSTRGLYHYLTYMVAPAPLTMYKNIYKLPAGYYMKLDALKKTTFYEWYSPLKPAVIYDQSDLLNEDFCINMIRTLMREGVQKRMIADVPIGAFLSGGIDSSLIVALMAECAGRVTTCNISFSDAPEYSEVEWAQKVSQYYGTDHHQILISEKEAFDFFKTMVYQLDEPIADSVSIPLYYVSKLLKSAGVTVVLVGEGSDELYCGYQNYMQYLGNQRAVYEYMPHIMQSATAWTAARFFPKIGQKINLFHKWNNGKNRNIFWSGALVFDEKEKNYYMNIDAYKEDVVLRMIYPDMNQNYDSYAFVEYFLKNIKRADYLKQMTYLELKHRLPDLLLTRIDKMTMANSLEARVPFLDHKHVEFALQIPSTLKNKNGITKYILKKACEGILPHDVIYRKKMGFATPCVRWLKEGKYFRPFFNDILKNKSKNYTSMFHDQRISDLFYRHQTTDLNYGLECWTLQNVLSHELFSV